MLLVTAAHALGYAASWLTEWYAYDRAVLDALGLRRNERIAGFVHIGRPAKPPRGSRPAHSSRASSRDYGVMNLVCSTNPRSATKACRYDPFKAIVAPRPIGWITSMSAKGEINLAPYSFFNGVNSRPIW